MSGGRQGLLEHPAAAAAVVRLSALLTLGPARGSALVGAAGAAAAADAPAGAAAAGGASAPTRLVEPADLVRWVALPALRADMPGAAVSVAVRLLVLSVSSYAAEGAARGLHFPHPRCAPPRRPRESIHFLLCILLGRRGGACSLAMS